MIYLFWTGGFDSTFRLCQALVRDKRQVQPIYINDKQLDNTSSSRVRRRNTEHEKNSMKKIAKMIFKLYPSVKENNLLKKLVVIENCDYDETVRKSMIKLRKKKYVRRSQCQYGGMAQVCKNLNLNIEVCAEIGGFFEKKLKKKMNCLYGKCRFDYNKNHPLHIFNRFNLPVIQYTKKDMMNESIDYGYDSILRQSWSCWYPVNNRPCGKCDMCRHRPTFSENFVVNDNGNTTLYQKNRCRIALAILVLVVICMNIILIR